MDHIKSRKESDLLIKGVNKTIKNESKEWKGGFLRMLLGTLGVSFLGNLLTAKWVKKLWKSEKSGELSKKQLG